MPVNVNSFSSLCSRLQYSIKGSKPTWEYTHTHTNHNTHSPRGATLKLNPPALAHKGSRINLASIKKYNVSYTATKWVLDKKGK